MKAALVLVEKQKLDRKRLILAIIVGMLFHLWLFYFTFPEMKGMTIGESVKRKVSIRRWRPPPKEKPKVKPPPKQKVDKPKVIVPVPDPTPDEPETIQELEPEPEIEDIPIDEEFVWGIPDAPDVEVGEEMRVYNQFEVSQAPQVLRQVDPSYPILAKQVGKEADVILMVVVDQNGDVFSHEVIYATGDTFRQQFIKEAVMAVYRYKFKPAIQSGHPVPCTAKITVKFRLK